MTNIIWFNSVAKKKGKKMKEFIEQYGNTILVVVSILVLIGVIVLVIQGIGQTQFTNLINDFFQDAKSQAGLHTP